MTNKPDYESQHAERMDQLYDEAEKLGFTHCDKHPDVRTYSGNKPCQRCIQESAAARPKRKQRLSQYLDAYLHDSDSRIAKGLKPRTPGSYLGDVLRGNARDYSGRYVETLVRSLKTVGAVECESQFGGTAYKRQ